jgi:hypothetical protein
MKSPKSYRPFIFNLISINFKYYLSSVVNKFNIYFNIEVEDEDTEDSYFFLKYFVFFGIKSPLDYFILFIFNLKDFMSKYFKSSRWSTRVSQTNEFKYEISHKSRYKNQFNLFMSSFSFIWSGLRYWVVGIFLSLVAFYFLMHIRLLPFTKIILEILLISMFLYWLLSGFVFFIKKYQYSKFTSVVQRFWKRSYVLFWLLETVIFLIFFYLTLNASEEPVYMYDQMKLYKTHLFSWRWFLIKLLPCVFLILIGYYLLLNMRWGLFFKQSTLVFLLTLVLIYIVWLEFYQFFHIVNWYTNFNWVYDYEEFLWSLDIDNRRTRLANNYAALCLMAKFWHLIFIFVFWVFFILRVNEIERIRYPLLAANLQNFLILYIMSWLYMYPWLKFIGRKYLDFSYYWFFSNFRDLGIRIFFNDLYLFLLALTNCITSWSFSYRFNTGLFFYWIDSSSATGYSSFIKHSLMTSFNM